MHVTARQLVGRQDELETIVRLLDAREQLPGAAILAGEAGIGKTTLWLAGIDAAAARGYQILSSRPAEAETHFSFAGLTDLLGTNIVKYACASHASVTVTTANDTVIVEVADDGVGGADPSLGSGLNGLNDRVEALGGRLEVASPPGAGTTLRAEIPITFALDAAAPGAGVPLRS